MIKVGYEKGARGPGTITRQDEGSKMFCGGSSMGKGAMEKDMIRCFRVIATFARWVGDFVKSM